jgi:type III secretion protein D
MELRMLSGLHRGAVLELGNDAIALGASHMADVILADPGVADLHLRVVKNGDVYQLCPVDGEVVAEDGRILDEPADIVRGTRFRVGEIWIGFFDADDPWDQVLPSLVPAYHAMPEPEPEAPKTRKEQIAEWWRDLRASKVKMAGAAAMLLALVLAIAWIVAAVYLRSGTNARMTAKEGEKGKDGVQVFGMGPNGNDRAAGTREKLEAELRRMLAERELLDRIDIVYGDDVWDIRGSLDTEEQGRLERTLAKFNKAYQPPFGLRASVVPVKDMLPFKVTQVTTGKYANIVTDGGKRMFVGDVVDGYKLVSVDKTKLVFVGKLRIEFAW